MRKVFNKIKVHRALFIIECPKCQSVLASASEYEYLPDFGTCDCDEKSQIYEVTYTKKIGGEGTILVKATSADNALEKAKSFCFTGSDFRNAVVSDKEYTKPRKQGFYGK